MAIGLVLFLFAPLIATTLLGKAAIVTGIVKLFGYPLKTALKFATSSPHPPVTARVQIP